MLRLHEKVALITAGTLVVDGGLHACPRRARHPATPGHPVW
jgi:hypothetical protein